MSNYNVPQGHLEEPALALAIGAARDLHMQLTAMDKLHLYPLTERPDYYPGQFRVSDIADMLRWRVRLFADLADLNIFVACREVEQARLVLAKAEAICAAAWRDYCKRRHWPRRYQRVKDTVDDYIGLAAEYGFVTSEALHHVWRHAPNCRWALPI